MSPAQRQVTTRLSSRVAQWVRDQAFEQGVSVSKILADIINKEYKRQQNKKAEAMEKLREAIRKAETK